MFGWRVLHPVHCGSKFSLGPSFHYVTNVDYKCAYGKTKAKIFCVIIQQIVTLSKYGHDALDIRHP